MTADTLTRPLPVSMSSMKDHLRIRHNHQDKLIRDYIVAAQELVESQLGITLTITTRSHVLSRFPSTGCIELPYPPLQSLTSIQYYDSSNASQSLDVSSDVYTITRRKVPAQVLRTVDEDWPATYGRHDAVTIAYTAGFGGSHKSIPESLKHAIRIMVQDWYEAGTPAAPYEHATHQAVRTLLSAWRTGSYADVTA